MQYTWAGTSSGPVEGVSGTRRRRVLLRQGSYVVVAPASPVLAFKLCSVDLARCRFDAR